MKSPHICKAIYLCEVPNPHSAPMGNTAQALPLCEGACAQQWNVNKLDDNCDNVDKNIKDFALLIFNSHL